MFKKSCFLLFFVSAIVFSQENPTSVFEKESWWLEGKVGLTFHDKDLARINEQVPFDQEIGNLLKFQINPAVHYAFAERFTAGTQIGFGHQSYSLENYNNRQFRNNYMLGIKARYYFLKIIPEIYLFSEIGSTYNFVSIREQGNHATNSYLKSYFDSGVSFIISEKWIASIILKDIFYHYSSSPNFDNRNGFGNSKVFQDFIDFPFFSVKYRLD